MARVKRQRFLLLAAVSTALAATAGPPVAAAQGPAAVPGEVIVRFERGATPGDRATVRDRAEVDFERGLGLSQLQLVSTDPAQSAAQAIQELERSAKVAYAEPNFYRSDQAAPDDTHFGLQWGLDNDGQLIRGVGGVPDADIDAAEAWALSTGEPTVTVAVIDGGVDSSHPDLAPNMWANPGETGGGRESNGVDDDRNGYVDDASGWDWVGDDRNPADEGDHGTHVAGTVGARGNDGGGVAGVGWQTRLMPLRVLDPDGAGTVSDLIRAYRYAAARGVKVVNLSLGGPDLSNAERDAIAAAPGTMFVAAAGNEGTNNDALPQYPCAHTLPNVVCVAASDSSDARPSFSNYGARSVDLAAPGAQIASTVPGGWAYSSGTSMAAPHVAGAAALVWALRPAATVAQVKEALLDGVDPKPAFAGITVSGGRLNLERALRAATGADIAPEPPPDEPPPSEPPPGDPPPSDARPIEPPPSGTPPPDASPPSDSTPPPASDPVPPSDPIPAGAPIEPAPPISDPVARNPKPDAVTVAPAPAGPKRSRTRAPSVFAAPGQRFSHVLRRGLVLRARCSGSCRIRVRLLLDMRTARMLGLGMARRTAGLGRSTIRLANGRRTVRLRFGPRLRRALARLRTAGIVIAAHTIDASARPRSTRSRLVLRR